MPFQSNLVPEVTVGANDGEVLEAMGGTWSEGTKIDPHLMVAVRNAEGHIYRTVEFHALNRLITFIGKLQQKGFAIELPDTPTSNNGYTVIVRK